MFNINMVHGFLSLRVFILFAVVVLGELKSLLPPSLTYTHFLLAFVFYSEFISFYFHLFRLLPFVVDISFVKKEEALSYVGDKKK